MILSVRSLTGTHAYDEPEVEPAFFVDKFRIFMSKVRPIRFRHNSKHFKPFVFKDINKCTHVFRLIKKVKPPLTRPDTGPHKVILRHPSNKYYKININGKHKTVSIAHLKSAFFIPENFEYVDRSSLYDSNDFEALTPPDQVSPPTTPSTQTSPRRQKHVPNILRWRK